MWCFEDQILLKLSWYDSSKFQLWNCDKVTSRLVIQGNIPFYNACQEQASSATSQSHDHGETNLQAAEWTDHSIKMWSVLTALSAILTWCLQFIMDLSGYNTLSTEKQMFIIQVTCYKVLSLWLLTLYNNLEKSWSRKHCIE